jgi:hypothetical protein
MATAGYGVVRYADDFVIFARSESEAQAALTLARQLLEGQGKWRLHPEKTQVVPVTHGFEFLGYHYYGDPQTGKLRKGVRRKSVRRFRERIRELAPRLKDQRLPKAPAATRRRLARNQRLHAIIAGLNRDLRSWHRYFQEVWAGPRYFRSFDE